MFPSPGITPAMGTTRPEVCIAARTGVPSAKIARNQMRKDSRHAIDEDLRWSMVLGCAGHPQGGLLLAGTARRELG